MKKKSVDDDDDDDDDWCFTATFVHMIGKMGRATSKGNEAKSKMKHPSDSPSQSSNSGGSDLWSNALPVRPCVP